MAIIILGTKGPKNTNFKHAAGESAILYRMCGGVQVSHMLWHAKSRTGGKGMGRNITRRSPRRDKELRKANSED